MTDNNKQNENNSRRKLLKTAAASSGIAVAATALPTNWTKPVVDSILLPVHAQMSGAVVGGVYTSAPVGVSLSPKKMKTGVQYALLNALISPANAQVVFDGQKPDSHIVGGICRGLNDDDDEFSPVTIVLRVNANDTVDIAVSSDEFVDDDGDLPCPGDTTIMSGTTIQDVTVQMDDDEFLALSNMVASATEITGSWSTVYVDDDDDDDPAGCGGTFTAPLGGSFPSTESSCADD